MEEPSATIPLGQIPCFHTIKQFKTKQKQSMPEKSRKWQMKVQQKKLTLIYGYHLTQYI